jgi:hypothetical protein
MAGYGNINLKIFALAGYDFRYAFNEINIYEDLAKNSYSGTCDLVETEGVREEMPLIGEEVGVIQFTSKAPISGQEHGDIMFIFRVNKIENIVEGSSNQRSYRLHFTSLYHELNANGRVRKHYRGTADKIVARLVKAHFGETLATVDPCKHEQSFVFPNWSPWQCINYMATISVSAKYNDPFYMCYHDRDGFHFTSLSQLMDKPAVETIDMKMANVEAGDDTWDGLQLSTFSANPLFDTLENQHSGMYGNTVITYDKITKTYTETKQTYTESYDDFKHVAKEKLTISKPENTKNRIQFIQQNRPEHEGVYTHVEDWGNKILHRAGQVRNNRMHVWVNGKTSIKLGDVIKWDFRSTVDERELDVVLSGDYLITKIRHVIKPQTYSMNMEIVKDGRG